MTKKIRVSGIQGYCSLFAEYIPDENINSDKIYINIHKADMNNSKIIVDQILSRNIFSELLKIRLSNPLKITNERHYSSIFQFYKFLKNYISYNDFDFKKQRSLEKSIKQMDTMPDKKVLHLDPIILRMKYNDYMDRYDTNVFLSGNMDYLPIMHFQISLDEIKYVFGNLISF